MEREAGEAGAAPAGRPGGSRPGPGGQGVQWDRVDRTLHRVRRKWVLLIMRMLASGMTRPERILAAVNARGGPGGLSRNTFYQTLAYMKGEHLVGSTAGGFPLEAHYWLTGGPEGGHAVLTAVSQLGLEPGPAGLPRWAEVPAGLPPEVDTTRPSTARVWNLAVGGKDHFQVDREVSAAVHAAMPSLAVTARCAPSSRATRSSGW